MIASSEWHCRALARCRHSLAVAAGSADRLALMRSLVRLLDGRLGLKQEGLELSDEEIELLPRFGLAQSGDQDALRYRAEPEPVKGLEAALRLDTRSRKAFQTASADGVLVRLTPHRAYQSRAQKAAVRALLTQPPGSGLMISMPTGSGKSLLFQLGARFGRRHEKGACVVVITPTIALALDHVRTLQSTEGLEASRALTGDTPPAQAREIVDAFRRGEVPILLLSPEKAMSHALQEHLFKAALGESDFTGLDARLTHLFVDEAHIVESWGRSFRPDFQRLPSLLAELRRANPDVRAVLLSATLTPAARELLRASWRLGGTWLEVDARTPRYEHDIVVASFDDPSVRAEVLDRVIDRIPRPAIVYTTEVAYATALFIRLTAERGYRRAAVFTGETPTDERQRIVRAWSENGYDLIVATSAFGMGIDNPHVRSIVHACLPESPARWYQEIGRAARDHGQGLAVCLFTDGYSGTKSDVSQAFGLATQGWLTRELAETRWTALVAGASNSRWEADRRCLTLDLDTAHEKLARRKTDYNRGWNMALLTLMQRASVIEVLAAPAIGDEPGSHWEVAIVEPAILGPSAHSIWDRVFELREREVGDARRTLQPFLNLMRKPEHACITRSVFEMIEPRALAPPCGRCPACRAGGIEPPDALPCDGLQTAWTTAQEWSGPLPGGLLLLAPEDPALGRGLDRLLTRLGDAGIEQFIVPDWLTDEVPRLLAVSKGLGLVLGAESMLSEARIVGLPTALLLPDHSGIAALLIARLREFSGRWPDLPMIVVASPDRVIDGRRLDQTVSASAPISERTLEALARIRLT